MKTKSNTKNLFRKIIRDCADCGKKMTVYIYADKKKNNYRGGHYFGKIGICSKKENAKMFKSGTRKSKFGKLVLNVYKYEHKPYKYLEHWECPRCYWGKS
jgi:hypothetical protein